jgi:hypothetical protein
MGRRSLGRRMAETLVVKLQAVEIARRVPSCRALG